MSTASVKASMKNLENYMNENSKYGVWDSEPVYVMRKILRKTCEGSPAKVPSTSAGWEIYSDIEDFLLDHVTANPYRQVLISVQ